MDAQLEDWSSRGELFDYLGFEIFRAGNRSAKRRAGFQIA